MHRLSAAFVLGFHGCDRSVGERLLLGDPFRPSDNDYDWLGPGIYFWESNPLRGIEFAREARRRDMIDGAEPFVVGAVVELGLCLDLMTASGIDALREAYSRISNSFGTSGVVMPR